MLFFLFDSFSFILSLCGYRGLRALALILGVLSFDFLRVRRKIILKNLDIVYGSQLSRKAKRSIGRKSMMNCMSTILEFMTAQHLLPHAVFIIKNERYLEEAMHLQKGVYGICMHFGNWEYLCHINAKKYSPVHVVVKDVLSGKAEEWIKNLRRTLGYSLIDRQSKKTAAQQIFHALDENELIGFIVDQKRAKGQVLPFFNHLASTNDSLAKLFFRKPAPILCPVITRQKPGVFCVEYHQFQYQRDEGLSLAENISKMTTEINELLEKIILKKPEEYYWLHNRWNIK